MGSNHWEDELKDMLRDYKPEDLKPDWNDFSNYLAVHDQVTAWEENEIFDENLKETVADFQAPDPLAGWERLEASLEEADKEFDERIREKVRQFEPTYHRTWPLLLRQISGLGY